MKSHRSMINLINCIVNYAPIIILEKITVPKWLEMTFNKNNNFTNEEPRRKKIKTEEIKVEIPKLVLSKHGGAFKSKLKFSNNAVVDNDQNRQLTFSCDEINKTGVLGDSQTHSSSKLRKKYRDKKKTYKIKIERTLAATTAVTSIANISSTDKTIAACDNLETMTDDTKELDDLTIDHNMPLHINLQLGPNQPTLRRLEQLHQKYFDKSVQDTVVIINNIVFMNLLANMHCMSRINNILNMTDKRVMAQIVQSQTTMYIKYVKTLDDLLRKYCIDVVSIFENADYEHALLMFTMSLYTGLQTFGSIVFKSGSVILNKLERVQWDGTTCEVVKKTNFDHNKILTTLKSETFCSCYHTLSTLIGQGSKTDPTVVKCWELFVTPSIINMTHFLSTIEAIVNAADIDTVVHLIEEASNNVRLCSHSENGENPSSSLNKIKIDNLIALVNHSTRESTSNNDQPTKNIHGGGFDPNVKIEQSIPIQDAHTFTPHIIHTEKVKTPKPSTFYENYPNTPSINIPAISIPSPVQMYEVKNMSISDPTGCTYLHKNCQNFMPIQNRNTSTPHIVNTHALKLPQPNTLYENFPLTYPINIPTMSIPSPVSIHQVRNMSTSVPNGNTYLYNKCLNVIPIQNGNPSTPHIMHTSNIKIPQPNTLYEDFPLTYSTDTPTISITNPMQMYQVRNISTLVPHKHTYLYQNREDAMSFQSENISNSHIVYAPTIKIPKPNTLYEKFPLTYSTDSPIISIPDPVKVCPSPENTYIHKKFNFTMHRVGNAQYQSNGD